MGKSRLLKMECGCEIWDGLDYQGRSYFLIEHCYEHKYVRFEELELQKCPVNECYKENKYGKRQETAS